MKVGILTLPFNNNYGGYLQAYALMTILKKEGHDVELIYRRHNKVSFVQKTKIVIKNTIKLLIGQKVNRIIPNREKDFLQQGRLMHSFMDKYICPKSQPLFSTNELSQYVQGRYETVIVGSDQIWRPDYVPNVEDYFLSFLHDSKVCKIAYAASFGSDMPQYTDRERDLCGKALMNFKLVTVRERSGVDVIKRMGWIGIEPIVVLDPTMLLKKEDYDQLLPKKQSLSKGKVFCYVLDDSDNVRKIIKQASDILQKELYYIIDTKRWKNVDYIMPSIEDWLCGIRDSDFVVTDSFHGMVFSIIFNKPFVVCLNKERGISRFLDLLIMLNLQERIMDEEKIMDIIGQPIEWEFVNTEIMKLQRKSITILRNSLQ